MYKKYLLGLFVICLGSTCSSWGFFGHRTINRLAVFTLPEDLLLFYKMHIDYLTDHAVDADKRRYSDPEEACRHYVDLDYYETTAPVDTVPKYWKEAVAKYTEDTLNAYGIVPWHINLLKYKLTEAFKEKNRAKILRISADIGHYVGDAHVPLHATMNYNGQLTNQHGIHGLWESRLPELFSSGYDFFTGRAGYIDNVQLAAWAASESSFAAKDSVLDFERKLSAAFGPDRKYTNEYRGQTQVKTYSAEYARAYHTMLGNQVERRMQASILMVGSVWYTAWVDAGQPDLSTAGVEHENMNAEQRNALAEEERKMQHEKKMIGRQE